MLSKQLPRRMECWKNGTRLPHRIKNVARWVSNQHVCLTNCIRRSTSNPKCHVTFSNTENGMSIGICIVFTSHSACRSLNRVCQLTCIFVFVQVFGMSNVKNLQKLCQKYTHTVSNGCFLVRLAHSS